MPKSSGEKLEIEMDVKPTFWDRIPKFKWWVTPLNIILICLFLIVIDVFTKPNNSFLWIDWAWWPIGGLIYAYIVITILIRRPAVAWMVGPLLLIGASVLLLIIDIVTGPNDGVLGLDWAIIPITALIVFGILIPIISKLGRIREKPIDRFRKALAEIEKQESKEITEKEI